MVRQWLKIASVGLVALLLSGFVFERYVEGTHYRRSPAATPTEGTSVVELFSYGCPHCRSLEPHFRAWSQTQPPEVSIRREAAAWNPRFRAYAQLYYTLDTLGIADKHNEAIFHAIHEEGKLLDTASDQAAFMATRGVDADLFRKTHAGDEVARRMDVARELFIQHQVGGVPAVLVNGTWLTDVGLAGGTKDLFEVVNFLVKRSVGKGAKTP